MPPIQCVKLRQISAVCDKPSTLLRTVAPVVVKPEIVSKSAFSHWGISPLIQNGIAPKRLRMIQLKEVARHPSFK